MKKWAIILILISGLDVLTTYFTLSLGAIETNLIVKDMGFGMLILIKMSITIPIACLLARLKLRAFLIFVTGANTAVVIGNLMTIWTLKTI